MQFIIDNEAVGATGLLTMNVDATADKDFTQTNLDANLTACVIKKNSKNSLTK